MTLSNKTYDILQWIVRIFIPAFIALYVGISTVLTSNGLTGLPYPEVVTGIIAAIGVFIGALMNNSAKNYTGEATMNVATGNGDAEMNYSLEFNQPLEAISKLGSFTVNVKKD